MKFLLKYNYQNQMAVHMSIRTIVVGVLVSTFVLHRFFFIAILHEEDGTNSTNIRNFINLDCKCKSLFSIGSCENIPPSHSHLALYWYEFVHHLQKSKNWNKPYPLLMSDLYKWFSKFMENSYHIEIPTPEAPVTGYFRWSKAVPSLSFLQGCKDHYYTPVEIKECTLKLEKLRGVPLRIAFVGDSITRLAMNAVVESLPGEPIFRIEKTREILHYSKKWLQYSGHKNSSSIAISRDGLELALNWAPFLDRKRSLINSLRQGAKDLLESWASGKPSEHGELIPDIIISGGGMWDHALDRDQLHSIDQIFTTVRNVAPFYQKISENSIIFWQPQSAIKRRRFSTELKPFPVGALDHSNLITSHYFSNGKIIYWDTSAISAIRETLECDAYYPFNLTQRLPESWSCEELVHFGIADEKVKVNLLWNLICNKVMQFDDNLCCL